MEGSKACAFLFILFSITSPCKGGIFGEDFSLLSCLERRNVTIIFNWYHSNEVIEKLLGFYLKPLIQNEACYIINIYDWQEDRVFQLREDFNYNHIERLVLAPVERINIDDDEEFKYKSEPKANAREPNVMKFVKRLSNEATKTLMKQTIVDMSATSGHKYLKKLQIEKNWDVIVFCYEYCHEAIYEWLPIHRSIVTYNLLNYIRNTPIKDLTDLIKNPDFNRFDFSYQFIRHDGNYFNASCMSRFNKIHISVTNFLILFSI